MFNSPMLQLSPFAFYFILSRAQEWLVTIFLNKEDDIIKNTPSLCSVCVCVYSHMRFSVYFPWLIPIPLTFFIDLIFKSLIFM